MEKEKNSHIYDGNMDWHNVENLMSFNSPPTHICYYVHIIVYSCHYFFENSFVANFFDSKTDILPQAFFSIYSHRIHVFLYICVCIHAGIYTCVLCSFMCERWMIPTHIF